MTPRTLYSKPPEHYQQPIYTPFIALDLRIIVTKFPQNPPGPPSRLPAARRKSACCFVARPGNPGGCRVQDLGFRGEGVRFYRVYRRSKTEVNPNPAVGRARGAFRAKPGFLSLHAPVPSGVPPVPPWRPMPLQGRTLPWHYLPAFLAVGLKLAPKIGQERPSERGNPSQYGL